MCCPRSLFGKVTTFLDKLRIFVVVKNITTMNKLEYKRKNEQWLEAKAKEDGVNSLPRGILYKVLESGDPNGKMPNLSNVVVAHYTGRTIDGGEFDNSYGGAPLAIRLRELIEGWIIALQRMHVGDKWELYIPAEMGYGKFSQPGIPAFSTLIFQIELIGIG